MDGSGYKIYCCLEYICSEVSLLYEEAEVSRCVLNTIIPQGYSMLADQLVRDMIADSILKIVFINLRHLEQIS
jgi:hypothetical protein